MPGDPVDPGDRGVLILLPHGVEKYGDGVRMGFWACVSQAPFYPLFNIVNLIPVKDHQKILHGYSLGLCLIPSVIKKCLTNVRAKVYLHGSSEVKHG